MRLFLTGSPGIGKTTLVRVVLEKLQEVKCAGFYTNLLATIAKKGKGFIEQIKGRNDIELIEVTRENRDRLCEEIAKRIIEG